MKYRKKPVVIEAEQFDGTNLLKGMDWDDGGAFVRTIHDNQKCYVMPGDYIIPEPNGINYYPCKPDIFAKTYEPESSSPSGEQGQGVLKPSTSLLCKLGSLIVHADEGLSRNGHAFDLRAATTLLQDAEVIEWLKGMDELALIPKKRNHGK